MNCKSGVKFSKAEMIKKIMYNRSKSTILACLFVLISVGIEGRELFLDESDELDEVDMTELSDSSDRDSSEGLLLDCSHTISLMKLAHLLLT